MASNEVTPSFGALLREHRLASGLTQAVLAERAGLSERAIQHLERGLGQPHRETARRLADALRLTGEHLARFAVFAAPAPRRRRGQGPPRPLEDGEAIPHGSGDHVDAHSRAEEAVRSSLKLEGERKQVSVLFAEISDSAGLLQARDPEDAQTVLDGAVEVMTAAVHGYQGTVSQIRGDGIMALFGAPIAYEDHAIRACYAALAIQSAIRRYAEETIREHGVALQVRVGVNSGEVVVRAVSSDLSIDYTAVGLTVHLAARMEQLADSGSILLAPETMTLVEGYVQVRALAPIAVKGLAEPVAAFELLEVGPIRARLEASKARGLTPFVARRAELMTLRLAQDRAYAGHGQVVGVVGEPGLGKSRLCYELTQTAATRGWRVLQCGAASYGTATPYLPVIDLLKAYCRIEARDDTAAVEEKLTTTLLTLDRALEADLPALLGLFEVPVPDPIWEALNPSQRRRLTLDAVRRLLLRESKIQPLLLVFEDFQWSDGESRALLDDLVESLPTARMLLMVTYRPEWRHGWSNRSYYTQARLDPLAPERAEELLEGLLRPGAQSVDGRGPRLPGDDPMMVELRRLLIERTEGNPFFLEECVRELVESGLLTGERGAYRLKDAAPSVRLPATVQTVLAARIDRLPPREKRLLQSAAVVGKDVPLALLRALAARPGTVDGPEGSELALQQGLAHLQAGELLNQASLFPELAYTFKHALTREVAYGSLLRRERRSLHAKIVDAIEALYPERLADQVERLAHHAVLGEVWGKALDYCRQAGAKAAGRSALREATAHFEQALACLEHLPEDRTLREQAVDLRFELRSVLMPLGELEQVVSHLRDAAVLADSLGDRRRLGQIAGYMAACYRQMGDSDRALESGQRMLQIAADDGDFGLEVAAHAFVGEVHLARGDLRQAMDCFDHNIRALTGDLFGERFGTAGPQSVISRANLVICLAELGAFGEGIARGEEAVRIAEELDHPYGLTCVHAGLGHLFLREGSPGPAIQVLERGLAIRKAADIPTWFDLVDSRLGFAYALAGRIGEALPLLENAVEQATASGQTSGHSLRLIFLGQAYLLAGHLDEATLAAQRALEHARNYRARANEAWALSLLGEIETRRHPPGTEQAEAYYRAALALAEEGEMRPLQARCRAGLSSLSPARPA